MQKQFYFFDMFKNDLFESDDWIANDNRFHLQKVTVDIFHNEYYTETREIPFNDGYGFSDEFNHHLISAQMVENKVVRKNFVLATKFFTVGYSEWLLPKYDDISNMNTINYPGNIMDIAYRMNDEAKMLYPTIIVQLTYVQVHRKGYGYLRKIMNALREAYSGHVIYANVGYIFEEDYNDAVRDESKDILPQLIDKYEEAGFIFANWMTGNESSATMVYGKGMPTRYRNAFMDGEVNG